MTQPSQKNYQHTNLHKMLNHMSSKKEALWNPKFFIQTQSQANLLQRASHLVHHSMKTNKRVYLLIFSTKSI